MQDNFVNLHCHSSASLQDSIIKIPDLISKVQEYGQTAVAVTDHSSCASWFELESECKGTNVKPIYGNEFYCVQKYEKGSRERDHLIMLAMTEEGLINIRRMQRIAVENFYYKPLISYDDICKLPHEGIYGTSACSLSAISKYILADDMDNALVFAESLYSLFNGFFSLELQMHPEYPDQAKINNGLVELSDKLDIPLTVSCDCHFIDENDRDLRRIVQAISWKKKYDEINDSLRSNCVGNSTLIKQFALDSNFQYMHVIPQAIKQTNKIAKLCNATLEEPQRRIPVFNKYEEFNNLVEELEW